jgi:hypothetical protein
MRSKLILAGLTAALAMAFAANSASARNLSISHDELVNASWRALRFSSSGSTVAECDVTLEGSFHYRTALKVRDSLLGYITRAIVNNCVNGGSATVLTTNLPWHIRYNGFEGALPNITGIRLRLILSEWQVKDRILGNTCLTRTTSTNPAEGSARLSLGNERRLVTGLTADPAPRITCGALNAEFSGTATVRELPNGNTNILVRLI